MSPSGRVPLVSSLVLAHMMKRGVQDGQLHCVCLLDLRLQMAACIVFLFLNIHAAAYIYMHADEDPDSVGTGITLDFRTQVLKW